MPLTIRIDSLRQTIRANEQGIERLVKEGEEGITQVATLQLMREIGTNILEVKDQNGEPQTSSYDSVLLRTLCVPIDNQLLIAETLSKLQVKTSKAKIAGLTAVITKGRQTILLGDVQRKTRLFTAAQPHVQSLQGRIRELQLELADSEQSVLADPNDNAIIRFQKNNRLLNGGEADLARLTKQIAESASKAESSAKASQIPDFAVDIAFRSGLFQAMQSNRQSVPTGDNDFITNLAVRLAQQIRFV